MVVRGIAVILFARLVLADAQPLPATAPLSESVQDTSGKDAFRLRQDFERFVERMSSGRVARPRAPVARNPSVPRSPKRAGTILIDMARSKDPSTRLCGLEGLARTCPAEQVDRFIEALADPAPMIRALAERVVASYEPDLVFERVMDILCSPPNRSAPNAYAVAVQEALPALRISIQPKMLDVLESVEEPLLRRETAAYCLGRMGDASAIPILAKCAWSPEPTLALSSTYGLVALRDPLTVPHLVRLTEHPIADVGYAATDGLACIGGPLAIAALGRIALTCTHEDEPGSHALSLLAALKDEAAVPVLIEVMRRNLRLRRAAARALYEITGEDLGDLPSDWMEWYDERLRAPQEPAQDEIRPPAPFQVEALE